MPAKRILAVDLGDKRTGLAIGDTETRMAAPFERLENLSPEALAVAIAAIVAREQIEVLICGVPLQADGSAGPRAKITERCITLLEQASGKPVHRQDERLTSVDAEGRLAGHFTRKQKRQRVDALAAARILQDYLDAMA